jgi:hypothetical protein
MGGRIGAMLQQDGFQSRGLRLGFGAVMDQGALQRRMRGRARHAQQQFGKLLFCIEELLELGKEQFLEVADSHGGFPCG